MGFLGSSTSSTGQTRVNWRWALYRGERRLARRLIEWLIARYRWHNLILDTDVPNVKALKCVSLTVRNSYGQLHHHDYSEPSA